MNPSLHDYQEQGVQWALEHKKCGLFLPMGSGKTLITLTAIERVLNDYFDVDKILIIGPKRVVETTWPDEISKWDFDFTYSLIAGTRAQREKALEVPADLYLIGKDNVTWLVEYIMKTQKRKWPFDMIVIDELSTFKNPQAKRFKAIRKLPYKRFIGLTGTPTPKGYFDLWSQIYLMDQGERLGKSVGYYRALYFNPGAHRDYTIFNYVLKKGCAALIQDKINDICMSLSPEQCTTLPDVSYIQESIEMPETIEKAYKELENTLVLFEADVSAVNSAVLVGKLSQFTSGSIYDDQHNTRIIHDLKIERLKELIEQAHGQNENVLVFYFYRHEKQRILDALSKMKEISFASLESEKEIRAWNAKELDVLLLNPASAGHGLNLQEGGRIAIYYSLPNWNLELYEQAIARIARQGQSRPVVIYHLLMKGTIDTVQYHALKQRSTTQADLLKALRQEGLIVKGKSGIEKEEK